MGAILPHGQSFFVLRGLKTLLAHGAARGPARKIAAYSRPAPQGGERSIKPALRSHPQARAGPPRQQGGFGG